MSLQVDQSLSPDTQALVKACYHLTAKAHPVYADTGHPIGYRVPKRELERVRAKVAKFVEVG